MRTFAFPGADALAEALATRLEGLIGEALAARGRASIAVSGGRSPVALFERLSTAKLDWAGVTITLVDERCVAADDPASNERLVRDHLMQGRASAASFIPLRADADTAAALMAAESAIRPLLPFDAVLLGMGEDGHTASLFPGDATLAMGLDPAGEALVLPATAPVAPHARLTLSLAAIVQSRVILLQIAGAAKQRVYQQALGNGPAQDMPIRAVLRQRGAPVEVWASA